MRQQKTDQLFSSGSKPYIWEAIVVGAGHAGLSASYYLKQYGIKHIVLERGSIGESWRSQRWESFVLNTANGINILPGDANAGDDPEGFCLAGKFVASLQTYASTFQLPVAEQTEVISVEKPEAATCFTITVSRNGKIDKIQGRQVVICSGSQNKKKMPAFAANLADDIMQLHTSAYRHAAQLPDGALLVVGSGQSGCQIAEDLAAHGRKVYLSTSKVGRIPRNYRGKDIIDWLIMTKFFDVKTQEVADPGMLHVKAPQLTGAGGGKATISLQALAQKGVTILGKMEHASDHHVFFQQNAVAHVQYADSFSKKIKDMIDAFIVENQIEASAPEEDAADMPDMEATCASSITSLSCREHNIKTLIWATGFSADFGFIALPVLDQDGYPKHQNGMTQVEGLYFLGLPWLRSGKSGLVCGIKDDAEFISYQVYSYSQQERLYLS